MQLLGRKPWVNTLLKFSAYFCAGWLGYRNISYTSLAFLNELGRPHWGVSIAIAIIEATLTAVVLSPMLWPAVFQQAGQLPGSLNKIDKPTYRWMAILIVSLIAALMLTFFVFTYYYDFITTAQGMGVQLGIDPSGIGNLGVVAHVFGPELLVIGANCLDWLVKHTLVRTLPEDIALKNAIANARKGPQKTAAQPSRGQAPTKGGFIN